MFQTFPPKSPRPPPPPPESIDDDFALVLVLPGTFICGVIVVFAGRKPGITTQPGLIVRTLSGHKDQTHCRVKTKTLY